MKYSLLLLILFSLTFALDRNYYNDEVKLSNNCMPSHMGVYGESGTPNNGWFETIEKCEGKATLKTTWGTILATNVTAYTTDSNSRINGILYKDYFTELQPVKTDKYSFNDAKKWANGMVEIMANVMDGRVFVTAKDNCISLQATEIKTVLRNAINMYHFYFPFIRAKETNTGWCFVEP